MYKTLLVDDLIDEGAKLIERLEARRFRIAAAYWYYLEDLERWRLVIVFSSLVDRDGPLRAYTLIEDALKEMQPKELSLFDISVMGLNDYQFRDMRSRVGQSVQVSNRTHRPWPRSLNPSRRGDDTYIYRWDV